AAIEQCEQAMNHLASQCTGIAAIVGYPGPSPTPRGRVLYNAADLLADGRRAYTYVKRLLPTYDVFDEHRYFEPGEPGTAEIAQHQGVKMGVTICEDLWNDGEIFERQLYHDEPIRHVADLGAQLLVNCSASP